MHLWTGFALETVHRHHSNLCLVYIDFYPTSPSDHVAACRLSYVNLCVTAGRESPPLARFEMTAVDLQDGW
jgi:hypothetical protein